MGVRIARKHVGWYLSMASREDFRQRFNKLESPGAQIAAIDAELDTEDNRDKVA